MTRVRLACGEVRGAHDGGVHAFKGIPFAEAVGGMARWLPAKPRARWTEVRDATQFGPAAMQFSARPGFASARQRRYLDAAGGNIPVVEGDDCLLLNVWTPTLDRNARLPVMVWIHGGGFTNGSANSFYDGAHLARAGVVMVVVQYRLGPQGFLHGAGLFDGDFCGDNRGLMDQMLALKWVQENIAELGGDTGRVTIFGESAGAFSVFQLAASPMAKGLFQRAIAMGGMAGTCAPAEDHHVLARELLAAAGVKPGDSAALAALQKPQLMRLQGAMTGTIYRNKDPQKYGELGRLRVGAMGGATGTDFLPQTPMQALRGGTPNDIDLMLGTCADDGQLFSLILPGLGALSARMFMNILSGIMPKGGVREVLAYYKQQMPGAGMGRRFDQVNNDTFYRMPTIAAAEAHAAGHAGRTWLYQIDYQSAIPGLRAIHGIDVALLFGKDSPARRMLPADGSSEAVSKQLQEACVRFATDGRPDPRWAAYDSQSRATMVFDRDTRVEADWGRVFREYWAQALRA